MGRKITLHAAKETLKHLFLTKEGWLSWFVANVITSLPWMLPLIYGFIFKEENAYILATSIWAFLLTPLAPLWIPNVFIALFLVEKVFKKKLIKE
jgi:hypothetical protein